MVASCTSSLRHRLIEKRRPVSNRTRAAIFRDLVRHSQLIAILPLARCARIARAVKHGFPCLLDCLNAFRSMWAQSAFQRVYVAWLHSRLHEWHHILREQFLDLFVLLIVRWMLDLKSLRVWRYLAFVENRLWQRCAQFSRHYRSLFFAWAAGGLWAGSRPI